MARATTFLFLLVCAFPQIAFANATSSSKIGISVVVKETPKCDFHIVTTERSTSYSQLSLSCQITTDKIQKQLTKINYQQQSDSKKNDFARVVLEVQ